MADQDAEDWKVHNVSAYSSDEASEKYAENAQQSGLSEPEKKICERFFTDRTGAILDIGCGAGRTTRRLAEKGYDVTGIDISRSMIGSANELYPDLDLHVGDVVNLPFKHEQFKYVLFSAYGLDYVYPESDRFAALKEIFRVLEPGGVFAFNTHNSWYNLPAVFVDRSSLKFLYFQSGNLSRLLSRYKIAPQEYDVATYVSNPIRQVNQLTDCRFEFLACVGKRSSLLKYIERGPHFVAKKPDRPA